MGGGCKGHGLEHPTALFMSTSRATVGVHVDLSNASRGLEHTVVHLTLWIYQGYRHVGVFAGKYLISV